MNNLKGKGYSHRRGANKDNFFVIRTAAVQKAQFSRYSHRRGANIKEIFLSYSHRDESKVNKLLFNNSSILFDNQNCINLLDKGAIINTLVGGLGKMEGGQKSFELPEGGGDQKVFRSKGGVKKV